MMNEDERVIGRGVDEQGRATLQTEEIVDAARMYRMSQIEADKLIKDLSSAMLGQLMQAPFVAHAYRAHEVIALLWAEMLQTMCRYQLNSPASGGLEQRQAKTRHLAKDAVAAVQRAASAVHTSIKGEIAAHQRVTRATFSFVMLTDEATLTRARAAAATVLLGENVNLDDVKAWPDGAGIEITLSCEAGRDLHGMEAHKLAVEIISLAA